MNNVDKQYIALLQDILSHGVLKHTRSGDVISVFGRMMRFNLQEGLPLLTTKKVFYRGCIEELLWFLKGDTNVKYLEEKKVHIWTPDAYRFYCELVDKNNQLTFETFPDDSASRQVTTLKKDDKETFIQKVLNGDKIKIITDTRFFSSKTEKYYIDYTYGDLGPVYGKQMRSFGTSNFDQIQNIIDKLKNNPDDRRILYTNYNPDVLNKIALPACHLLYQFYVKPAEDGGKPKLSCSFICRSQDEMLGTPFNILQASVLTHIFAEICDMEVDELIYIANDAHIYCNHIDGAKEQISRKGSDTLPTLRFARKIESIDDIKYEDFIIEGYNPDPPIKCELSVG